MTLFAATIFLSSFLLFLVQPMISKMLLPEFGGSPSVWLTCMVFFQAMLLAGYSYVHVALKNLTVRNQKILHACLLVAACAFLPLRPVVPLGASSALPVGALLVTLFRCLALPFAVLASTAPLLQKWFSLSGLRGRENPYPLYSVSNLGSLLGLLSYPFLIEPRLKLSDQSMLVAGLFLAAGALVILCAIVSKRETMPEKPEEVSLHPRPVATTDADSSATIPTRARATTPRAGWVILSFLPASLLLGVTSTISVDIAAVPLIWVVPLSLYLITFAIAFSRRPVISFNTSSRLVPLFLLPLTLWIASNSVPGSFIWVPFLLHLTVFFFTALACHGELASLQPESSGLTGYYVWIALGGCLGGVFNSILAPLLFDRLIEYPLMLILAALVTTSRGVSRELYFTPVDLIFPLIAGAIYVGIDLSLSRWIASAGQYATFLALVIPAMLAFACIRKPLRFAMVIGTLLMAGIFYEDYHGVIVMRSRSFFGVYKVTYGKNPPSHTLSHGNTIHGRERLDAGMLDEPLTYYHPTGPMGQVYEAFRAGDTGSSVAVVGLGAGSLAAYSEKERKMDFYEIDPAIERIARDTKCFHFLARARGEMRIMLGDARISLRDSTETYGLIVLDAFSSDAIPVHLLTREAIQIYLSHLSEDGILAFHISNRYLDLVPVLKDHAADFGLFCLMCEDDKDERMLARGASASLWMAMGRKEKSFDKPSITTGGWIVMQGATGMRSWTDDYSPIAEIFRWR